MTGPIREGIVMVLLAQQKRVRHLAVWSDQNAPPGPLCRNRGALPNYGNFHDFEGVPICTNCAAEVELLASAVQVARYGQ